MSETAYIPASGLTGKVKRLAARALSQRPLTIRLNAPLVSFTFDDFPKSAAAVAAPLLEAQGWTATYFTAGGFAAGATHHGAMFDAADLARLAAAGHEIGCHTFSHLDAGGVTTDAFLADVDKNAAFLAGQDLAPAATTFAFPFGEATPALKRRLSERFALLRGVRPGINRGRADRALLKAVPLDGGLDGLQRALDLVREAARTPGWLIFYGHDVQDNPTQWGCTPQFLSAVIEAVAASQAEVRTMAGALDRIEARRA